MKKVIVIGAGASGLIAGGVSAKQGNYVVILDKNERVGKKLYITGKGRCNLTNAVDKKELLENVVNNSKFMMSAFSAFESQDVINLVEDMGVPTKIERGNRVFPLSDKANDVIYALEKFAKKNGAKIELNTEVERILTKDNSVVGVELYGGRILYCDKLIIATGGLSYPSTGSTGDGYMFAKNVGHNVTPLSPGLVQLDTQEDVSELAGLTLKNIKSEIIADGKSVGYEIGELLFTHNGVSGPTVLTLSSKVNKALVLKDCIINIDLKPYMSIEELDKRVLKDFEMFANKDFRNSLDELLPKKLISYIIEKTDIDPFKKVNTISKKEREKVVLALKNFSLKIKSLGNYYNAIITVGGVDVREINPKTMESKLVKNLFFCGEVLDVDALTGGFNLQVAFSSGYVAGLDN